MASLEPTIASSIKGSFFRFVNEAFRFVRSMLKMMAGEENGIFVSPEYMQIVSSRQRLKMRPLLSAALPC